MSSDIEWKEDKKTPVPAKVGSGVFCMHPFNIENIQYALILFCSLKLPDLLIIGRCGEQADNDNEQQ